MEHWHTPHVVADLPPAQRVLVLAPHPDDEIFGCGGVLALYRRQGAHVQVHVLTDGAGYAPDRERAEIARIRMAETDAALSRLDIGPASTSGLRDRTLAGLARLPLHVAEVIARHRPEVVLFPADGEIHPDHRALARAVRGALAVEPVIGGPSRPVLLGYEIGAPLRPNLLVDITSVWALKQAAMQCFVSQQARQDYAGHIEALNRYRTYTLPADVRYAEALAMEFPAPGGRDDPDSSLWLPAWAETALAAADAQAEAQQRQMADLMRQMAGMTRQMADLTRQLADLREQVDASEQLRRALDAEKAALQAILQSTSWRITGPLRWLAGRQRRARSEP